MPVLLVLRGLVFGSTPRYLCPSDFLSTSIRLIFSLHHLLLGSRDATLHYFYVFLVSVQVLIFRLLRLIFPGQDASNQVVNGAMAIHAILRRYLTTLPRLFRGEGASYPLFYFSFLFPFFRL